MNRHRITRQLCIILTATSTASIAETPKTVFTPKKELGNVMYVGDSITHGVRSGSYRRELFKIFVDNGISQKEVGINSGHYNNYSPGPHTYRGVIFQNRHSSISSERAYEIAGRINTSGRLGNSNIHDWLGLNKSYTGTFKMAKDETPDTFFMMIGTNDLLADHRHISEVIDEKQKKLLGTCNNGVWDGTGDMDTIVKAMRQSNPHAQIALTVIPTWVKGRPNNNAETDLAVTALYNQNLIAWGKQNNIAVINVNKGITDVAETKYIGAGVASMFSFDKLHPAAQGDLLIAGNFAKGLGYPGRTVGLKRKSADGFRVKNHLNLAAKESFSHRFDSSRKKNFLPVSTDRKGDNSACMAEFSLSSGVGDGAENGWDTSALLSVSIGNGTVSGTLNISESSISWGNKILYSTDTSTDVAPPLRIVCISENKAHDIAGGFYVWLGDMLIGEALPASPSTFKGITFINNSAKPIDLKNIGAVWGDAFAPL